MKLIREGATCKTKIIYSDFNKFQCYFDGIDSQFDTDNKFTKCPFQIDV